MLKKIITYLIGFILCVVITLLISLIILSGTILNKNYTISMLEKNDYYKETYNTIVENFDNHIMQSGLEKSTLEKLFDEEKVKQDVNQVIEAIYGNKEIQIDTQSIRQELENRINKVLEQNNRIAGHEEIESIKEFEDVIVNAYANGVSFSKEYVEKVGGVFPKIEQTVTSAKIICAIIAAVLFTLIIVINKNIKQSLKYVGTSVLASGILLCIVKLFIGDKVQNVLILSKAFSETIKSMVYSIANTFLIVGIITIIIGVIMIITGQKSTK